MLRSVIWTFLILVTVCAPLPISHDQSQPVEVKKPPLFKIPQTVLPAFKTHLQKFLRIAKKYGKDLNVDKLIVMFGPTAHIQQNKKGYVTIGYCQHLDGIQLVVMDKKNWNMYSYKKREMLAFHEFSHCLLDQDHRDELDIFGNPISIMNSVIFSDYVYADNQEYYWKELFTFNEKDQNSVRTSK